MSYTEILNSDIAKRTNVIYSFVNKINGKVYVGQTRKQLRERLAQHIWQMKYKSSYFHKALVKHGLSNFDINILDSCENADDLDGLEIYWISYYNSTDRSRGYNRTTGGSGLSGNKGKHHYTDSDETKQKKSKSAKKKWQDPLYRQRYKNSRKEYIKVVKLTLDGSILEIYPTITDAEKSIYGKKTSKLWFPLQKYKKTYVDIKGFRWMLLDEYNKSQESRR